MNAPDIRRLKPDERSPLKTYDVYRQWRPVEVSPLECRAVLTHEGEVRARSAEDAIYLAKALGLLAPVVKERA